MLKYIILALAFIGIVFFVLFKFEKLDKPEKKKSIYILIAVLILSLAGIVSLFCGETREGKCPRHGTKTM